MNNRTRNVIRDKRNLTATRKTATNRMRNAAADKSVIVSANAKIKSVRSELTGTYANELAER